MSTFTASPAVSHDFDFMVGRWKVHNRFLNGRLRNSHIWLEYDATYELRLLLNGLGNIDQCRIAEPFFDWAVEDRFAARH